MAQSRKGEEMKTYTKEIIKTVAILFIIGWDVFWLGYHIITEAKK